MSVWDEIHGFMSPGEFKRFVQYLEGQLANGVVREQPADPLYGKGMIYGGRWFQDIDGVLKLGEQSKNAKRTRIELRIPYSLAMREYRRRTAPR